MWLTGRSDAASAGELPLLEALLAEDRPPLRGPEGNGRRRADGRTGGLCLDAVRHRRSRRGAVRAPGLAALAAFRLVLELLVSVKQLFARGPDELGAAVYAPQDLVLELHRPPP